MSFGNPGSDSFIPTELGLATTINGSDMTVSDQTGEVVIALAIKTGKNVRVLLARVSSNGMATGERLRSADGHEQHVQQHELLPPRPARRRGQTAIVVTYITEKNVSSIVPTSETTTLRSLVRPAVGPASLGDVDGRRTADSSGRTSTTRRSPGAATER